MKELSLLQEILNNFYTALESVLSLKELDGITSNFLGKKGHVTQLFQTIKTLSLEEKKLFVPELNKLKFTIEHKLIEKKLT